MMDICRGIYLAKNSLCAIIGGVGILLGLRTFISQNSMERIQWRVSTSFNGNLHTKIISCYSPSNCNIIKDGSELYKLFYLY